MSPTLLRFLAGVSLAIVVVVAVASLDGCARGTYLAPNDQALLAGAKRDVVFVVVRQDGGMPRADRLLADDACKNLVKVLTDAKLDGGTPCP